MVPLAQILIFRLSTDYGRSGHFIVLHSAEMFIGQEKMVTSKTNSRALKFAKKTKKKRKKCPNCSAPNLGNLCSYIGCRRTNVLVETN